MDMISPDTGTPVSTDDYTAPEPVNTDIGTGSPAPSNKTASERAAKATYGLAGVVPKTYQDYYSAISNGDEDSIRREAAVTLDYLKQVQVQRKVERLVGPAAWNVVQPWEKPGYVQDAITKAVEEGQIKVDPRSVFEESYAHQYMDTLSWAKPEQGSGFWLDAEKAIPDDLKETKGLGDQTMAYREYILKKMADVKDQQEKEQSYVGWGFNKLLEMSQLYNEQRLRGNEGSFFKGGLGLGTAEETQARAVMSLPFDQFKDRIDAITYNLSGNPDMALKFLDNALGMSTGQVHLDNTFSMFAIPDILGVTKFAIGTTRTIVLRNQINRAVKTHIEAAVNAPADRPPDVVAPAAAGDLKQASINQTAHDIDEALNGVQDSQVKQGVQALMSGFKDQIKAVETDPGNLGQEGVNRIKEDTLGFMTKVLNGIQNVIKIERIPGFLASKEAVAAYRESIKNLYPGFKNSILDIGTKIYWDNVTNTYHVPFYFGDGDAYFAHAQTAYNRALTEGLVPARETLLQQVNEHFGTESSKLNQKLRELQSQLRDRSGPSMAELDVDAINKEIAATRTQLDDLLSWHADKLTEPGIDKIITKDGPGFHIVQQGNGYAIRMSKPLNETDNIIRDALFSTKDNWTPHNFWKDILGWGRTPDEVLSSVHNANRKVAAYAPSVFLKILKEDSKMITQLYEGVLKNDPVTGAKIGFLRSRVNALREGTYLKAIPGIRNLTPAWTRREEFVRVLEAGNKMLDDKGLQGKFFSSPGELERFWLRNFGHPPEPVQTAAYFSFRRNMEADHVFRELILYKNASRLGAEEHSIAGMDEHGNFVQSPYFHGIKHPILPGGDDNIMVMGKKLGDETLVRANEMAPKSAETYREMIVKGQMKVIKLYNAALRPLNGFGSIKDEKIHYVLTPNIKTRPITFGTMLPRRGGGHIVYDYDHYIKQAIVRPDKIGAHFQDNYEGDATIMPISNRAMGQRIAAHLDQVRLYLKDGNVGDAKRYAIANLPIGWDELHGWFLPRKTPEGVVNPPRLGLNEPIQVVPKGKFIGDMDNSLAERYTRKDSNTGLLKSYFRDSTKGGSPGEQFRLPFASERDAELMKTINDYGTAGNPIFKYEPSNIIDPMVTINRSLKQIADSFFMDDYKLYSVEHWLEEAKGHLDTPGDKPLSEIRSSPFYYFYNGKYKSGVELGKKMELELRRYQIKQLLGVPGMVSEFTHWMSQKLADAEYEDRFYQRSILGNKAVKTVFLGNSPSLAPSWAMARITKPAEYLRTAAYHAMIGMWSLPQLIAQSMTYVTIAGVAGPTKAVPGSLGALLHQYARWNPRPEVIDALDNIAHKIGAFKPGEWKEAFLELQKNGFDHVGGEHQTLERIYKPTVVSNGAQKFLNAGDIIFKGSERNARFGSWYTAYKEFREENPTGRISNLDRIKLLDRADFLSGNMSRASKSILQSGIGEFPSQFLGYTMRVAEQFTGSRMSRMQKLRLATVFAAAFGLPQATSLTGFPAGEYLRQYALDNGYVVGDKFWSSLAMEGVPSMLIALASGGGDIHKGTFPNVGQRFGAPGLDIIRSAIAGDKPLLGIMAGASGSFLGDVIKHTAGFRAASYAAITGDDAYFKMKPIDLVEPLRAISSINYGTRAIYAINTLKWLSKNETNLAQGPEQDITPWAATLLSLTGTQPQQVADLNAFSLIHKNDLAAQKDAHDNFIKEWHRMIISYQDDDPQQAEDYKNRAYRYLIWSDYPMEKRDQLVHEAEQGFDTSLLDRLHEIIQQKNVPENKKETRRDLWERSRQIEIEKREPQ